MKTPNDKSLSIGAVFTPLAWGKFAIDRFGLFDKWMDGASVYDPTMGEGDLLAALVEYGLEKGIGIDRLPVKRLFGNELNTDSFKAALTKFQSRYGLDMQKNFSHADIIFSQRQSYDIIFGNPPWSNFQDLPASYKDRIKAEFVRYGLTGDGRELLLGGSRIDIAALVIRKVILENLKAGGEAIFFMPLSLLLNDGAHKHFRNYRVNGMDYRASRVFDFQSERIFEGITTRYGLVRFIRDKAQSFPIPFHCLEKGKWKEYLARPLLYPDDPLSILEPDSESPLENFVPISVPRGSLARQGVNTCGANSVFFFDHYEEVDEQTSKVSMAPEVLLPKAFVYPLLTAPNFREKELVPVKWVLLPYGKEGQPLSEKDLQQHPLLLNYLRQHESRLKNRKGSMLKTAIRRGIWWALLGVGPYNFAKWKIVWEAYGRKDFRPKLLKGNWQANQALQAFIPLSNKKDAVRILQSLKNPAIENYLRSLKMEGGMNWAQPGKIKRLLTQED